VVLPGQGEHVDVSQLGRTLPARMSWRPATGAASAPPSLPEIMAIFDLHNPTGGELDGRIPEDWDDPMVLEGTNRFGLAEMR
jgi:hypothetical protein